MPRKKPRNGRTGRTRRAEGRARVRNRVPSDGVRRTRPKPRRLSCGRTCLVGGAAATAGATGSAAASARPQKTVESDMNLLIVSGEYPARGHSIHGESETDTGAEVASCGVPGDRQGDRAGSWDLQRGRLKPAQRAGHVDRGRGAQVGERQAPFRDVEAGPPAARGAGTPPPPG